MGTLVQDGRFVTTRWSVVLAAGERSRGALQALCRQYWYPLYAFARRSGVGVDEARDEVQGFLLRLIDKNDLAAADQRRGRFRSWLLGCFKHWLSNSRDRARAEKRGGGAEELSFDAVDAESRYKLEPADHLTAEKLYSRQWTLALLARVLAQLRVQYEKSPVLFERLSPALEGDSTLPYAQIAQEVGKSEGAVKVDALRMRRKYAALLRAEVAETVERPEEVDVELRELFADLE
jgi:DNA-directed RNA polymerase specialized sigma24 family protein